MDRTLYLNEKKGLVVMRDGPSLWIREKDKAGMRVPARLVNMVFIVGNIRIDAGAITLFAENNTPVTLMNRQGEAVGVVMPYNNHLPDHYDEQKRFAERDENPEAFRRWIASMRRETQLGVIKKIDWDTAQRFFSKGFKEREYDDLINGRRRSKEEEWKTVHNAARNLLLEMVIREIVTANLDPHMGIINKSCNFGFALDLYDILDPEADLLTCQFFVSCRWHDFISSAGKQRTLTKEGWKNIVHRFENRKKVIAGRLDSVIRGFFSLLRQVIL